MPILPHSSCVSQTEARLIGGVVGNGCERIRACAAERVSYESSP